MMCSTSIVKCVSILITGLSKVTRQASLLFLWLRFDGQCPLTEGVRCLNGYVNKPLSLSLRQAWNTLVVENRAQETETIELFLQRGVVVVSLTNPLVRAVSALFFLLSPAIPLLLYTDVRFCARFTSPRGATSVVH